MALTYPKLVTLNCSWLSFPLPRLEAFDYAVIVDEDVYVNVPVVHNLAMSATVSNGSDLIGYIMQGISPMGEDGEIAPHLGKDYRCPR